LINRCIVLTGKLGAAFVLTLAAASISLPALADSPVSALYQRQTIRFTHVTSTNGAQAIGVDDPGFQTLLRLTGATLTWRPGERYVLITTSAPVVVSFALGDRRYDVGSIALDARFAPYQRGNEVYLPLDDVLGALGLALRHDGAVSVLQPQLSAIDVHQDGNRVMLLAHAGATLHPRILRESDSAIAYAFDGVGTTLSGMRAVNAGGVRNIQISESGSVRNPTAVVTVELMQGAVAEAPRQEEHDVVLTFDGAVPEVPSYAQGSPIPQAPPAPEASSAPTMVTGVTFAPAAGGITVAIAIAGNATYQWHRLRDPDNRFWVDIKSAQLQGPPIEENAPSPIAAIRVRQADATTVRVALTLQGPKSIEITPSTSGLGIVVGNQDVADAPRSGAGTLGAVLSANQQNVAPVTPAPIDQSGESNGDTTWKFGRRSNYVPTNPRLIVLDPGHGGSDRGSIHGGVSEADLTLDMAKRLRDILLARGWQVKMTRDTDVDVYAADDSAREELQARVDVANKAGARLFVSIHANAFINSGPYGTTCYVSKPDDFALARIVESYLAADGTKDDGIVKSHLYVTLHTRMPAVLVETAFLSNPSDYALLTSPAWRQKVAQEIADGIGEYAKAYPVANQPAE
jgi:N-acetylmuramoyl-L-alanine amidase